MDSPVDILKTYWNFSSFRGKQEKIIDTILQGKDVLALLPTGGGKSICFQVPTMMMDGLCLVITPLIALMKDQVDNLTNKNISAVAIHSGLSEDEVADIYENAIGEQYKFLYISPERIETAAFQEIANRLNVCLIAVDEAHCISQWGYDFRPPYLRIAQLKEFYPSVPILALTASATSIVEKDIIEKLKFENYEKFRSSFQRNNLAFKTILSESKFDSLSKLLSQEKGCAIVYCNTRKLTQEISRLLTIKNISSDFYHAGLTQEERDAKQQSWMQNKTRVIVCTNAFGMGIDKPDVRLVVHYNAPDCLENYYQEAGRAGRDEQLAKAFLLYDEQDIKYLQQLPNVRFPSFAEIKKTYQHLCDFLQIPLGAGEKNFYDFDLNGFAKNFHLNIIQTIYCIKALEQADFISFNENIFLPSKINFRTDKETLYDFEKNYPQFEDLIKCLLRTYEGIFLHRVSVYEKQVARILHTSDSFVIQQLQALQRYGIIEYLPQKETPQIFFHTNRTQAEFLLFNHEAYLKRKKLFVSRVEKLLQYIHTKACRSAFIAKYFDDEKTRACGICDNCVEEKSEKFSSTEMNNLSQEVLKQLNKNQFVSIENLMNNFPYFSDKKIREVIIYLQREGKIKMNFAGEIALR